MKKKCFHVWHDDWLRQNLFGYSSYTEATEAYCKEFGIDICMAALKNHCRYKLGIAKPRGPNYRHVTEEQKRWLTDIYPNVGVLESMRMWNERYNDNLTATCIKQIARYTCDITVKPHVATANKLRAVRAKGSKRALRRPGDTRMECGRLVMKAEDGTWKSAGRCIWERAHGRIPDGYALIALDGDTSNIDLANLEIVPWRYLGKLSRNNFFSSDPEITKTGIVWCDLDAVLKRSLG